MVSLIGAEAIRFYNFPLSEYPRLCDLYKKMGCRIVMSSSLAGSLTWQTSTGLYGDLLKEFHRLLAERNMKYGVLAAALYTWEDQADRNNGSWKSKVINNVDGEQDIWIDRCSDYINQIRPDLWHVADEFVGNQTDVTLETYIQFVERCIDAYRVIKPDLVCAISGFPFWDLKPLLNAGGIKRSNIVYCKGYYYAFDGSYPTHMPSQAYWNAETEAELQNAKNLLWSYLDNEAGFALAKQKGARVWLYCGANRSNPNYMAWMRDILDYAVNRGIDFNIFMPVPERVLNADFTDLNEIGYLASEYMTQPPIPPIEAGFNLSVLLVIVLLILVVLAYGGGGKK